jgi:hypothetical protein
VNFGAPWMLAGLPLVAVPIVIHLLQRRRYRRVDFAAMEFLRLAMKRMRRRVLLEDILLLALRTLAVLVAILALAQPGAERAPDWLARSVHTEILVLDASLSMNHRAGGMSSWERSVAMAEKMLDEADGARGARAAVVRAGLRSERLAAGDPLAARLALQQMEPAGSGAADLAGALETALRTAEDLGLGAPPRVTVFTDLQASAWNLAEDEMPALARLLQSGIPVEIVDTGASVRDNVAIIALELPAARWFQGEIVDAVARLRNFGAATAEFRAECLLDGDPVASEDFRLGPGESADWSIPLIPRSAGVRAVEVRLAHDALAEDDARAASFEIVEAMQIALVGELAPRDRPPGVCDAFMNYLELGEGAPLRPRLIAPNALDARALAEADVAVLADPGSISPSAAEALKAFLERGGGLLIALGPQTGEVELAFLRSALATDAVLVESARQAEEPFTRLTILDEAHPALRFFLEPRWRPLLTEVPFREWRPLRVADPALARTILAFTRDEALADAGAALVEERSGPGLIAWLAAAPHSTWNRMEEVPGGTLALIYDLVFHLAPATGFAPAVEVGESLEIVLPAAPLEVILRDPEGARFPAQANWSSAPGERLSRVVLHPSVNLAGVWRAEVSLLDDDGSDRRAEYRLAVGTPPAESDLRAADATILRGLLPPGVMLRTADEESALDDADNDTRADYSLLFWKIVLGLFAAETLLAAWQDRRRQ